jgi:hypothetical protein
MMIPGCDLMKHFVHLLLALILMMIAGGCNLSTQTSTRIEDLLDAAFLEISGALPLEITEDLNLPQPGNPAIGVTFLADGIPLSEPVLAYDFPAADHDVVLTVRLNLGETSSERSYTLTQVFDSLKYAEFQKDLAFLSAENWIEERMATVIESDFTLPVIPLEGVTVEYTSDRSYIFNGRFIFDFPLSNSSLTITAAVTIGEETREYAFQVSMKGLASLPRVSEILIETENHAPIVSKDEYIDATLTLVTYDDQNNPTTSIAAQSIEIRGRGNSTFFMPKMPFRIKFPSKTAFLNDYAEKTWVLLANYTDQTLVRNYLANQFSSQVGMAFSPSATFADVYLNGEYIGNYLVTDQIEVSSNRVDIDKNSTEVDTGYLLEMDLRLIETPEGVENVDYFYVYGRPYAIKSPKTDDIYYTVDQFNYISDYIVTVHETLMNGDDFSELIDLNSFVDWFLIEELFKNVDSGYSSVYMYKDSGQPLKMGPIWDMDLSSGNQQPQLSAQMRSPIGWYTSLPEKNVWFHYLMNYEDFREAVKTRWDEWYAEDIPELIASIYPLTDSIAYSRYLNFQRWDVIGTNNEWYTNPEILALDTYEEQVKYLVDYLTMRSEWLNQAIHQL